MRRLVSPIVLVGIAVGMVSVASGNVHESMWWLLLDFAGGYLAGTAVYLAGRRARYRP